MILTLGPHFQRAPLFLVLDYPLHGSFSHISSSEKPFFPPFCSIFQLLIGQFYFDSRVPPCRRQAAYDPLVPGVGTNSLVSKIEHTFREICSM